MITSAGTGLFALLAAFVSASMFTPVQNTDAYSAKDIEVYNDPTGYYVDVSSSGDLSMSVESTYLGATDSATDTVTVKTNSPLGYKLYISSSNTTTGLYYDKDATTATTVGYISAIGGTLASPTQLTENTWGWSLDSDAIENVSSAALWVGMPDKDNAQVILADDSENATSGGESINVYYGVKVTNTLPGGTYGNTIVYTGISDGVESDQLPTMQDFTASDCTALTVGTPTRLVDSRDLQVYKVTRLADGHCWMVLKLRCNIAETGYPFV